MKSRSDVDFNQIAVRYEDLVYKYIPLAKQLFKKKDEAKTRIIKHLITGCNSILDFGCGIGLLLPGLSKLYPWADLYAYDESLDSLKIALHANPKTKQIKSLTDPNLNSKFDLIVVSCVLHHIESCRRIETIERLMSLVSKNGSICILEHNPKNAVTQLIVKVHPIDKGVTLVSPYKIKKELTAKELSCKLHYFALIPLTSKFILLPDKLFLRSLGFQYCFTINRQ